MIFILEDDQNTRELVVYTLRTTGHEVRGFEKIRELYRALEARSRAERPQMLVLNTELSGDDGMNILKKLREGRLLNAGLQGNLPVIMLGEKDAEFEAVKFLDAGADDYVAKPFGMMELAARIRAVLRRTGFTGSSNDEVLSLGNITMNIDKHKLEIDGNRVELTAKEFELFKFLLQNKDSVLKRERLLDSVWGYEFSAATRTVDVHIGTLRQKLTASGAADECIQTIRGVGYRISSIIARCSR